MLFKTIGAGNFVATLSKVRKQTSDRAFFDLYRIAGGLNVEHWEASEGILPREQWGNSRKF
ncbi:MAG: hypothetical protein ACR2OJ_04740 [Hyphomicrobiales bacterium]